MQEEKNIRQRKILLVLSIIAFIGLCVFGVIAFVIDSQKTASVEILVAPSNATIKINDRTYKNQKTSKIVPGEYGITISASGFITQDLSLSFSKDKTTKLYIILEPTPENADWYNNHPTDNIIASTIGDYLVTQEQDAYQEQYPIVTILPFVIVEVDPETYAWTEFRVDYGQFDGCKTKFCIKITDSTGGNETRALQEIRQRGFNPDDYEIIYDYEPIEPLP